METLESFVEKNSVEKSDSLIDEKMLKQIENYIGVKIGGILSQYLLKYGYLSYEYIELYGITKLQGTDSDMVKQTLYLHEYFPLTKKCIALENQGEGDYYLVNSEDKVFEYDTELGELTDMKLNLEDYILQRFRSVK